MKTAQSNQTSNAHLGGQRIYVNFKKKFLNKTSKQKKE